MPGFVSHSLDSVAARVEVAELRALLFDNANLKESVFRGFFRERLNTRFHKLQDMTNAAGMEARFGKRAIDYAGVLVVGRNQHIDLGEHERLRWRREHVIVNSKRIICVTYDQLLDDLEFRLDWLGPAAQAEG